MRRTLMGFAATALMAVVPSLALAGDNQAVADQIARNIRDSGQISDYKIGVKYQDGTAWLRGRVADQEQLNTTLRTVFQTPGVQRVVNQLEVAPSVREEESAQTAAVDNPLREQSNGLVKRLEEIVNKSARAERLSSSFGATPAQKASAEEMETMPQPMAVPRQARPMTVAMQPGGRGPMAPNGGPLPMYTAAAGGAGVAPARYDQPCMPNYAWPSYAAYPNYAAVTYPKQYSPTAWPYIGPFYPYPQVPLGWRKVTLEWDDGWWFLDFKDQHASCWHR